MKQPPVIVAAAVALAVLLAGTIYALAASPPYTSTSQLVLVPDTSDPDQASGLLESFERSGTIGTFVEFYSSANTLQLAGNPPVTLTVRAVPDSRVMSLTTSGDKDVVRAANSRIIVAGRGREAALRDLWATQVLETPGAPEQGQPTRGAIILATLLVSILAAGFAYILLRRGAGPPARRG
jgi:hypothetical protein